jgi:MFS transporter, ACS family, D-galactonate transporter
LRRGFQLTHDIVNLGSRHTHRPDANQTTLHDGFRRRRWILIALLTLAAIVNYLDRATISVALPKIAQEFTLSPTAKGLVLSSFFWCYTLLQIPVGVLVDRSNLHWLFAGAFALWSVSCGLTGVVGGVAALVAARVILGIGESVLLPGTIKLVDKLFEPRDRGLPTGLCTSGTRLGLALGTPLVAWLTVRYGWREMFILVGFIALIWLLPWILAYPGRNPRHPEESEAWHALESPPRRLLTIDRNLVGCCLGYLGYGYYQYVLLTWLPDYFVHVRHFQLLQAGICASVSYLIWGLGAAVGGWIADSLARWGWNDMRVRKSVVTVAFASGLFLIPAIRAANATSAMLLLGGSSLVGLSSANTLVILQDCAPFGEVGAWTGASNFVGNLGGVISPLVTGVLISRTGSYFPGFALSPLVLVAAILPYWLMVRDPRSSPIPKHD